MSKGTHKKGEFTVRLVATGPSAPYFIVHPLLEANRRVDEGGTISWTPDSDGVYSDGQFYLVGISSDKPGDFGIEKIDIGAAGIQAKAKKKAGPVPYILYVLDVKKEGEPKIHMAYGETPDLRLVAGQDPPKPPPVVVIE